jgi:glycerophosphoryl diester phosphodiesterase
MTVTAAAPPLPRLIGHRGAALLAPENTLAGFRKAAETGVPWVEFDVRLARDGRCVLLHDDTLERTTTGTGRADLLGFEALQRFDAGAWFGPTFAGERVPSFEETIDLLAALGLGANVEVKPGPGAEVATGKAVAEVLRARWPKSLPTPLVSSFKEASLAAVREAAPELPRGLLISEVPPDWRARAEALGCVTIHCNHKKLERARAREIVEAGFPLLAYTVNEPARAEELWRWGLTTMITDCPDRLLPVTPGRA